MTAEVIVNENLWEGEIQKDLEELYTRGSSRGPPSCHFSTAHNKFYNASAAYSRPMRVHLDLVPGHYGSDQELWTHRTFRLKAGSVVYLPLNFLQQLTQRLTHRRC